MPIIYHEKSKTFHLFNEDVSYVMKVSAGGHLVQLHYGQRLHDRESFDHLLEMSPRPMSVCYFDDDPAYSLEHLRQEYPTYGIGDMRPPAIDVVAPNGSPLLDLGYRGHEILEGKPPMEGLPSTYVERADEARTLIVELADGKTGVEVRLFYTIFSDMPIVARHAEIVYKGAEELRVNCALSMALDLPDADFEMVDLVGAWARERHVDVRPLHPGAQGIYSLRGCSSHHFNPFLALRRPTCDEHQGEAYGFSLVYSGNFMAQVDVDSYHVTRVRMGIHPEHFEWRLSAGESFVTPEVVLAYSADGMNALSQAYHRLYRARLARGVWRDRVRPILVNNWEATYFDFSEEQLLEIARTAADLGIELFVLDDGWFTNRSGEDAGLGDWEVDTSKLPHGLSGFSSRLADLGLLFGLWIEPEMVSRGTRLYEEHPEWVLHEPGRRPHQGRNQYVLDFSNPDVVDYLFARLERVLDGSGVAYVKWDMNRSMSDAYSCVAGANEQGTVMHRYILGVYRLYGLLCKRFPEILFESCASGGARFDPGMLAYAPQCWTSDDTDAVERLKIQYGTSLVYPISSMGAHVAAVPNHQLDRITSLGMRANVAFFGVFGYELDLSELGERGCQRVREQVDFMKRHRELLQFGTFFRLKSPFEGNEAAWMVVSSDRRHAIVGYYRILQEVNVGFRRVRLAGLDPSLLYQIAGKEEQIFGDELMGVGLITSDESSSGSCQGEGDFASRIYVLDAVA